MEGVNKFEQISRDDHQLSVEGEGMLWVGVWFYARVLLRAVINLFKK